ncbi:hypothetical protein FOA43_002768 [Brettanomyces nanus]|uniref:Uncharacterized protein n=1 Tax=Eeniella nana TaxID=13502 RepID=A0A875S8I9_EENNA|nr:uncharacterized protein FOA43_002768 [Brettanomyces nanus]QPG75414.1 hypothetical protein FOA43_002768 [Brettanomyces nanus]
MSLSIAIQNLNTGYGIFNTVINMFQMVYVLLLGFIFKNWCLSIKLQSPPKNDIQPTSNDAEVYLQTPSLENNNSSASIRLLKSTSQVYPGDTSNSNVSKLTSSSSRHFEIVNFTRSDPSENESLEELYEQNMAARQNGEQIIELRQQLYEEAEASRYLTTAGGEADDEYDEYEETVTTDDH